MNGVNKTLYIPLYGKAYVSKKGLFLEDKKAEEIWDAEGFALKGKSKSKWLAYYMGIRSAVFDGWLNEKMIEIPDAVIIHIGCGMDSRILRVGEMGHKWFDLDFPQVIEERKRYFKESESYKMLSGDALSLNWSEIIPESKSAIVVMEGVSMYMTTDQLRQLTKKLSESFDTLALLTDCYSVFAAKMSKYKNPINDVGVTQVYGLDDPCVLENCGFKFHAEQEITPISYIDQLQGIEKKIFTKLYAGNFAKKLYKLYEFKKTENTN